MDNLVKPGSSRGPVHTVCQSASYVLVAVPGIHYAAGNLYPPPLVLPGRGVGGPSLGQHKIFCCGSPCCCVGDCVVRHCQDSYQKGQTTTQELPKAFQWKVVSMFRSSRSSGAGTRNLTPSWSRSRSQYIGSPLNASYAVFFRFAVQFLCLCVAVRFPKGGWGTVTWRPSPRGWRGTVFPGVGQDRGGGGGVLSGRSWKCMVDPSTTTPPSATPDISREDPPQETNTNRP